jgi:ER membrane protein complex subunit 2
LKLIHFPLADAKDLLLKWRENNERRSGKPHLVVQKILRCLHDFPLLSSDEVVQMYDYCLVDKMKKLGSERLVVLEQVFVAALDCGRIKLAEDCIRVLISEFPESLRIMKLKAMLLEALERYDDALDVLESIIKKDETNAAARKRKVAILKAKGLIGDAIRELCDYLRK